MLSIIKGTKNINRLYAFFKKSFNFFLCRQLSVVEVELVYYLCGIILKDNIMYWDLITEEDEVVYTNDEQLSYSLFDDDYIELYVDDFYIGKCKIWYDVEMNYRHYIVLNYGIVYLDTIKLI